MESNSYVSHQNPLLPQFMQHPALQNTSHYSQPLPQNPPYNGNVYHQSTMNDQSHGHHSYISSQTNFPSLLPHQRTLSDWQTKPITHSSKRLRSPEEENPTCKQVKPGKYWLGSTISTQNRYAPLGDNGDLQSEETDTQTNNPEEPKPPPIFVAGVKQINPLLDLLNKIVPEKYVVKALHNDEVRIQPSSSKEYTIIVKALKEKDTEFYTYQTKQSRPFRVVLKNVHPSTNVEEIKNCIQELGHDVINILNIQQRKTKKPLPLFFIDLKRNENNQEIYNVRKLLNLIVTFEPPHIKQTIPQCMRCQRHGHTKNFCTRTPRCVKCAGNHFTKDCTRTERNSDVKCVNCSENHPANYKGCVIYQQLHQRHYPRSPLTQHGKQHILQTIRRPLPLQPLQSGVSYAEITNRNSPQHPSSANVEQQYHATISQPTDILIKIEKMIDNFMDRMGKMIDLITTLISKMH